MNWNLFKNWSSSPSIPGMDMGNMDGFYDPKLEQKEKLPPWLPGGIGSVGDIIPGGADKKEEESMSDVWGRFIGKSTLDSHTDKMAGIGQKAMATKAGFDMAQKAVQQIAANNVQTGMTLAKTGTNMGFGFLNNAKNNTQFNTQYSPIAQMRYFSFM